MELSDLIRCCAGCRRIFASKDLLCSDCWSEIEPHLVFKTEIDKELRFNVHTLCTWDNSRVECLLRGLKCGSSEIAMMKLATRFYSHYQTKISRINRLKSSTTRACFVPAPVAEPGRNHALVWAKSLSSVAGITVLDGLLTAPKTPQKTLSERSRNELQFNPIREEVFVDKSVIFVDDLITTGATARAAYRALGYPDRYEVWAIGCRPRFDLL